MSSPFHPWSAILVTVAFTFPGASTVAAEDSAVTGGEGGPAPAGGLSVGLPVDPERIVDQRDHPDSINGCGPASILNLLELGGESYSSARNGVMGKSDAVRLRYLTEHLFENRRSAEMPGRMRWGPHGVVCRDFAAGLNELLAESDLPELRSAFLDREEGEVDAGFRERIRGWLETSLEHGTPPVLALRSQSARRGEKKKEPAWQVHRQHFVVIASVESEEESGSTGFRAMALEPNGGRLVELYLFNEPNGQPFRALRGSEDRGEWLGGRPFLQVLAPGVPSLRPANLEWSERFLVTAHFLMGDF